jgi:hypothetical protein
MLNGAVMREPQTGEATKPARDANAALQTSLLAFLGHGLVDHLLAAVETIGRDAVTQMRLAAGAID